MTEDRSGKRSGNRRISHYSSLHVDPRLYYTHPPPPDHIIIVIHAAAGRTHYVLL